MKSEYPVAWLEGLFLEPQHYQQTDRFHAGTVASRLDALEPLGWGVQKVKLDPRALAAGQIGFSEFTGVLPDGTHLCLGPGAAGLPATRAVGDAFSATADSLLIYLALPRERSDGFNNYGTKPGGTHRYVIAHESMRDAGGVGDPVDVPLARPNLSILFESDPRDDVAAMPVAKLTRQQDGALAVHPVYVPPCTRVDASVFLQAGLTRLLRLMATRQRELSAACRQRDATSVEFATHDVPRFLLLSTINTRLPILSYYADTGEAHPRALYLALSELAGALGTFSTDFDPLSLPKFQYQDLQATFEELFARLTGLLRTTIAEHFLEWGLESRQDGIHLTELPNDDLLTCRRFFLAIRSEVPEQETVTTLPRISKVASWSDIQNILSAATPGAPVEISLRPPAEIPIKAGHLYFSIQTENSYWRNVLSERKIAVYLPQPFTADKTQVQLLGIPGSRSERIQN